MIFHFVFSKNLQTPSFPVNLMSIKDVHHCHCDPNNAWANVVGVQQFPKTNRTIGRNGHTCLERIGRANSIQIMVDCSMVIATCNESGQNPPHPREEQKENNEMKHRIYEIIIKGRMWLAVMHAQCSITTNFHLVINTAKKYLSLLLLILNTIICGLSHGPPTCPWHLYRLYSFCSLRRLCISKWRFHSWLVGGVLGSANRTLICWKSWESRGT